MTTPNFGDTVDGKGVYAGIHEVNGIRKEAYLEPDFLRDASGKQLILTIHDVWHELTRRNGGRSYGKGTDAPVRKAIASGEYKDGDMVLASLEFLSGKDAEGNMVRPDGNLAAMLQAGKESVRKIQDTLSSASGNGCWSVSGTEGPPHGAYRYLTKLPNGHNMWHYEDDFMSGVVPVRFFSPAP